MRPLLYKLCLCLLVVLAISPGAASAQPITYHLHQERSATSQFVGQLRITGPDDPVFIYASSDMMHMPPGDYYIQEFDTQANKSGTIPAGSQTTFDLWMRKTGPTATIYPAAKLYLNDQSSTLFCGGTGTTPLTTTFAKYTFSCTSSQAVPMVYTDRLLLQVWFEITVGPGGNSVAVEVATEGEASGNYDSTVTAMRPPPTVTTVIPDRGPTNTQVRITGTGFGQAQGTSAVTFNGTTGTPSLWISTTIDAAVPPGATSGPVVVSLSGMTSNGVTFTVVPGPAITSVSPNPVARGQTVTITGSNFLMTKGSSTVTFGGMGASPTSWTDTAIVVPVPAAAATGPVVVSVSGHASNGFSLTVDTNGTLAGTISRANGGAPLAGATVQAVLHGVIKATLTSAANGTYSAPSLDVGTYDVRVHAAGYSSEVRSGTIVSPNTTTTVDVAMSQTGSISGKVTQADGTTPIAGAAVTLFTGGIERARVSTNASGDYTMTGLRPGAHTGQAAYPGYRVSEQGVTIVESSNAMLNLALATMPAGAINYVYDELGRLVMVADAAGDTATYTYDAVGNIMSIGRIGAGSVSITEFTPNAAAVGATVTIHGTGFSAVPAQNTLSFNGTAATATSSTTTRIDTVVPPGATTGPIAVTTPLGSATSATFTVQAVSGAPSISSFTPAIAVVGTALTITGANFDPLAINNRVTLHQTFATLTSNTAVQLGTAVPHATTSGRIAVGTPNGTAVSADDLYIPPADYTAADVVFTSRPGFGDAASVVASINTANRIGLLLFDAIAGQAVGIKLTQGNFFGTLTLFRPTGASAHSAPFGPSVWFSDVLTLDESGTYTILVDPGGTYTGTVRVSVYDVVHVTGPITPTPTGTSVAVTILTPGQNALLAFAGAAGQQVSALASAGSPVGTLSILRPDGTALGSIATGSPAGFLNTLTLPSAGTHTLLFNPTAANTGSTTLTLYDVVDLTPAITPGAPATPISVSVGTPGQRVLASFTAVAGQRVSATVGSVTIGSGVCRAVASILDPTGVVLATNACVQSTSAFVNVTPPLAAGPHSVLLDPNGAFTGGATLSLHNVPTDWTGSITPGSPGTGVTVPISVPGQNGILSFNGTNGQRVSLSITGNTTSGIGTCTAVTIRKPDASPHVTIGCVNQPTAFIDVTTLTATGLFTILVDPAADRTGNITLALHNVSADDTGPITPGAPDSPSTVSITVPGQNAVRSFSGTATQRVSLGISGNTTSGIGTCTAVTIRKPDDSPQATIGCVNQPTAFIEPTTLSVSGTHSILVNPATGNTGAMTLKLSVVPADVTGTLTVNAAETPVALNAAGQNATFTFSGTASQLVTVRVTGSTFSTSPCVTVKLFRQDGTTQLKTATSCSASFNLAQHTLPATENYIVKIDPLGVVTGSLQVRVTNP